MMKIVTMREALASPAYFGNYLAGPTWAAWRVLLIAIMGEELTPAELVIFTELTGRATSPTEIVREFWGVIGRRGGKSRATAVAGSYIAACCDHRAVLAPGELGVLPILAASIRQAQQLFNFMAGIFEAVPRFRGLVDSTTGDTLRLATGVEIRVTTASWRTVRSITAISAVGDEVAFWRSDDSVNPDEEIIGALKPALLTTGGMFIGISSPYSRAGELFKAWKTHHGPDGDPRKLVAKAPSLTMNPSLPAEEIAQAYKDDPAKASAEYGGNFRDDIEAFVSRKAVEACVSDEVFERAPEPGKSYVGYCDPSGGSADSYTLAIAHKDAAGKAVLDLLREERPPFSPEDLTARFVADLKRYGIRKVKGDKYAGEFPRELFRKHGITYEISEHTASAVFQEVLPAINSGNVALLDNARLINQLCALERRTGRSGKDSISHPGGGHDDLANAAAGALINAAAPQSSRIVCTGLFDDIVTFDSDPEGYRVGETLAFEEEPKKDRPRQYGVRSRAEWLLENYGI